MSFKQTPQYENPTKKDLNVGSEVHITCSIMLNEVKEKVAFRIKIISSIRNQN